MARAHAPLDGDVLIMVLACALALAAPYEQARDELSGEHIQLQGLLRGRADLETQPEDGDVQGVRWQAARALVRLKGPADLSSLIVGEVAGRVRLLDAWVRWKPSDAFFVRVGHFRPDASPEMRTPLQLLPLVDRSLAVRRMAPGWDWGVAIGGQLGWFAWNLGAFESRWLRQDGSLPLGSAKIGLERETDDVHWFVQLAAVASRDQQATWLGGPFEGERVFGVLAAHYDRGRSTLDAEVLGGVFDPAVGRTGYPIGGHITATFEPTKYGSVTLRAASWGRRWTPAGEYELWLGGTLWPWPDDRPPVEAKLNLRVPLHRRSSGDIAVQAALQLWL